MKIRDIGLCFLDPLLLDFGTHQVMLFGVSQPPVPHPLIQRTQASQ